MEPRPAGIFCPGPSVFPPEARSLLCAGDGGHGSRPSDHTKTGIKHGATTAKVSAILPHDPSEAIALSADRRESSEDFR